jgi:hypothetical protein
MKGYEQRLQQPGHLSGSRIATCSLATSRAALGRKARESLRANVVHQSFFGPLPKYTPLPGLGHLMAMLTIRQIPKLSASFCI